MPYTDLAAASVGLSIGDKKSLKRKSDEMYDLPTKQEQLHLRETENLMKSNLLRLQIEELLAEVRFNDTSMVKTSRKADELVLNLVKLFQNIDPRKYSNIDNGWLKSINNNMNGIVLEEYNQKEIKLTFAAPKTIKIIGSHALRTITRPYLNVDVMIIMPNECFDEKDILNHAYFDKRKLYLAVLCKEMLESKYFSDHVLSLSFFKGDTRKPIISLKSNSKPSFLLRLIPAISHTVFKLNQLKPTKNNIRPIEWISKLKQRDILRRRGNNTNIQTPKGDSKKDKVYDSTMISDSPETTGENMLDLALDPTQLQPTPGYNSAILEDMAILPQFQILSNVAASVPVFRDCVILIKIWLTQIGLRWEVDGFDGHLAALLVAYLIQGKKINQHMPPLSCFQAVLKFFVETDFTKISIDLMHGESPNHMSTAFIVAKFTHPLYFGENLTEEIHDQVNFNTFWRLSLSSLRIIRREAIQSMRLLQHESISGEISVGNIFLTKKHFADHFDLFVTIPGLGDEAGKCTYNLSDRNMSWKSELAKSVAINNGDFPWMQQVTSLAIRVLERSLGDRALDICSHITWTVHSDANPSENPSSVMWSIHSLPPTASSFSVTVGIKRNDDEAVQRRRVDRCPSAFDENSVASFREFWGPMSELRRFKDGAIVEAVIWPSNCTSLDLISHIAMISLNRNFPYLFDTLDNTSQMPSISKKSTGDPKYCSEIRIICTSILENRLPTPFQNNVITPTSSCFLQANEALSKLRMLLLSGELTGIPLPVDRLTPICPALRYTSLIPPYSHPVVDGSKERLREWAGRRVSRILQALPLVLTFGRSSKWPTDIVAVRQATSALLIRLAERLKDQKMIKSVVHANSTLDVFFEGFVFRIFVDTDQQERFVKSAATVTESVDTQKNKMLTTDIHDVNTISAKSPYYDFFPNSKILSLELLQLYHSRIHNMATTYPAFSATVRLLELWVAEHSFSGHITNEVLELLVCSVFEDYVMLAEHQHPTSPFVGLLRALLRLCEYEWSVNPLIVYLGHKIKSTNGCTSTSQSSGFGSITSAFYASQIPEHGTTAMPIILAIEDDVFDDSKPRLIYNPFGSESPEKPVFILMQQAAKLSVDQLRGLILCSDFKSTLQNAVCPPSATISFNISLKLKKSWKGISNCKDGMNHHRTAGTMASIEISPSYVAGPASANMTTYTNLATSDLNGCNMICEIATPNPLQTAFVDKLRYRFGHIALFFWNEMSADTIGIVWRPVAFLPQKFSLRYTSNKVICMEGDVNKDDALAVVNVASTIAEIIELSDGLVEDIIFI